MLDFKKYARFLAPLLLVVQVALVTPTSVWAEYSCETFLVQLDPSTTVRELRSIKRFTIVAYNVENLALHVGKFERDPKRRTKMRPIEPPQEKPREKVLAIGKLIDELDADFVVFVEVDTIKTLREFAASDLKTRYTPILIEGNDPRGIDVAFLIKNDLPLWVEVQSFKKQTWIDPRENPPRQRLLFSRDLPVLLFRPKGAPVESAPLFAVIGTHYKSKRPPSHHGKVEAIADPESNIERRAQVERTAAIINQYKAKYGEDFPILLGGDFNGDVNAEPEFEALVKQAHMTNSFDLLVPPPKGDDRVTHIYFPQHGEPVKDQLDALYVSGALIKSIREGRVYRYDGNPLPTTHEERDKNPSDHWPVVLSFDSAPILKRLPPETK